MLVCVDTTTKADHQRPPGYRPMTACLGGLAVVLALSVAPASATELAGRALVEELFATCESVLADPQLTMQMGKGSENPPMITSDGKFLSASQIVQGKVEGSMRGSLHYSVLLMPGGIRVHCELGMFGNNVTKEELAEVQSAGIELARKLVGDNAVSTGGPVGGTALLKALSEGFEQILIVSSPEFPPMTQVSVSGPSQYTSVGIMRYKAAP
jgi:hypothetical protein